MRGSANVATGGLSTADAIPHCSSAFSSPPGTRIRRRSMRILTNMTTPFDILSSTTQLAGHHLVGNGSVTGLFMSPRLSPFFHN